MTACVCGSYEQSGKKEIPTLYHQGWCHYERLKLTASCMIQPLSIDFVDIINDIFVGHNYTEVLKPNFRALSIVKRLG